MDPIGKSAANPPLRKLGDMNLDRVGLEVLAVDECWSLVEQTPIGRVAFVVEDEPLVLPVNFIVVDREIVFRTVRGTKFSVASKQRRVAFEVDDWDTESQTGWSVLVAGSAEIVVDPKRKNQLDRLELRPWAIHALPTDWARIIPTEISGRRVRTQ